MRGKVPSAHHFYDRWIFEDMPQDIYSSRLRMLSGYAAHYCHQEHSKQALSIFMSMSFLNLPFFDEFIDSSVLKTNRQYKKLGTELRLRTLILRYTAFAVLATLVNLGVQRLVLAHGETSFSFALAMSTGTIAGLMVKYLLDKRWIFYDAQAGLKAHRKKFSLYAVMGLITTAIFWGMETAFWVIWRTDMMRELGAIIGLNIGYVAKYQLDRRYVFPDSRLEPSK